MGQDVFAKMAYMKNKKIRRATKCSSQKGHRTTRWDRGLLCFRSCCSLNTGLQDNLASAPARKNVSRKTRVVVLSHKTRLETHDENLPHAVNGENVAQEVEVHSLEGLGIFYPFLKQNKGQIHKRKLLTSHVASILLARAPRSNRTRHALRLSTSHRTTRPK